MVVGVCTLQIEIPASQSLKDKRHVVKSLITRVRHASRFNVSIAEVDSQDSWQHAVIGIVCVSPDERYAQGLLAKVIDHIERSRMDAVIADYSIEIW